jgi:hypothetical protein
MFILSPACFSQPAFPSLLFTTAFFLPLLHTGQKKKNTVLLNIKPGHVVV